MYKNTILLHGCNSLGYSFQETFYAREPALPFNVMTKKAIFCVRGSKFQNPDRDS